MNPHYLSIIDTVLQINHNTAQFLMFDKHITKGDIVTLFTLSQKKQIQFICIAEIGLHYMFKVISNDITASNIPNIRTGDGLQIQYHSIFEDSKLKILKETLEKL